MWSHNNFCVWRSYQGRHHYPGVDTAPLPQLLQAKEHWRPSVLSHNFKAPTEAKSAAGSTSRKQKMLPTLVFLMSLLKTSRVSRSKRLWFVNIQLQPEVREVQPLRKHLKKRILGLTRKEVFCCPWKQVFS